MNYQISGDRVMASANGAEYVVQRRADGYRAWCVNASSRAWNRGFARTHEFKTAAEVEAKYKRLPGIAAVLQANFERTVAGMQ